MRQERLSEREMKAFGRVEFAQTLQQRVQAVISTRTKAEARIKKERVRKLLILKLDFQPKRDMALLGNQTMDLPAVGLTIPELQLLHGLEREIILHGWHQSL